MRISGSLAVIAFIICVSCNGNKAPEKTGTEKPLANPISFYAYCDQMPKVKLPLTVHLYNESIHTSDFELPEGCPFPDLVKEFYDNFQFSGVINNSEKFTTLLFAYPADDVTPVLVSFDPDGKKIATQSLYPNVGVPGPWAEIYGTLIIETDLHITLLDSGWSYSLDSAYNRIDSTFSRHRQDFQIDSTGNIIELKQLL